MRRLVFPLSETEDLSSLEAGQEILVEGVIYTARDSVHQLTSRGEGEWPFELKGNAIYYCGPTPALPGFPLGSCGPTTSARMDPYTPELYAGGLAATIGKGPRSRSVVDALREYGGVYLAAYGGCGALYASCVREAEVVAYRHLGPQAIFRVRVESFPVLVGVDSGGRSIFKGEF